MENRTPMSEKAAGKQRARAMSETDDNEDPPLEGLDWPPTPPRPRPAYTGMGHDTPGTDSVGLQSHPPPTPTAARPAALHPTSRDMHTAPSHASHGSYTPAASYPQSQYPSTPYTISHHRSPAAAPEPYRSFPTGSPHSLSHLPHGEPPSRWVFSSEDRGEPAPARTPSAPAGRDYTSQPAQRPSNRFPPPARGRSPPVNVKEEPRSDNEDFPEVSEILSQRMPAAKPPSRSQKPASSRANPKPVASKAAPKPASKAKGPAAPPSARKRGRSPQGAAQVASAAPRRGGRQPGATTYTEADYRAMMDFVRDVLPLGPDEWARVRSLYNERAQREGRPERQVKPLRSKFESLARTPKPTGDAEVPWWVEEAWIIDNSINERAHVRPLDDDEGIDGVGGAQGDEHDVIEIFDSDEEEPIVKPDPDSVPAPLRKKLKTGVTTTTAASSTPGRQPRTTGPSVSASPSPVTTSAGSGPLASRPTRSGISNNLLNNLATAFDPATQTAREDARAARQMENTVLQMLLNEMHSTRDRTDTLLERLAEQTRRADRLENELHRREWERRHDSQPLYSSSSYLEPTGSASASSRLLPSAEPLAPQAIAGPSNWSSHHQQSPPPDLAQIAAMAALAREEAGDAYIHLHPSPQNAPVSFDQNHHSSSSEPSGLPTPSAENGLVVNPSLALTVVSALSRQQL
ncbi:uncharacterized protein C8Q71DRAFT_720904 [Rhodofomes roseus]|uniref:DUF6818 domain-containing protein n=1 Tax=Rhodofomes roseus TaxID=34475 RepID=A0ABQ8KSU5_9APHY|nr:uncharacterized protein C8Q71DRAFT_720904 [Rhodofomes roseus]KAH9841822.1 hypothetical protein C8Q71DRAFT_720904 [Rhodofomes roseus]